VNRAFVLDSSVAISWVVESQSTEGAARLLDDVMRGSAMVVPLLWMFEVANSLLILWRRRIIAETQYQRARRDLIALEPIVDEDGPRLALETTSALAKEHSLSLYDAVYLELSLRRGLPLATRDAALNKAAKAAGITTLL
jgi:predicted nucleic acid-binding protein